MTPALRYSVTALVALLVLTALLWPWLPEAGRRGVVAAGVVAYPVQVVSFAALVRFWNQGRKFLLVWMGGTVLRMAVVLGVGLALFRVEGLAPAPTLLSLAGFFFLFLLLEPWFLRAPGGRSFEAFGSWGVR